MYNKMWSVLKKCVLPAALSGILLCGCGNNSANTVENTLGEIMVITREDGSGTRTQFEESLDLLNPKADMEAQSTEDVISSVEKNANAIGYAAGVAVQDTSVKTITVNGVGADNANIKNGKYPLSRDYSLVYNRELSEVQEDFLKYIKTAGQKIVEEYCIPVSKEQTFLSNKKSGKITICGSSSMEGVINALTEGYISLNPNADIEITVTDSSDGIQKAMKGACDFGMASRALKSYESELLDSFVLGRDGIAVIVNEENVIENITLKQLKAVYSKEISDWKEVR